MEKSTHRAVLRLHTVMSDKKSLITPKDLMLAATAMDIHTLAITDLHSVQCFYDMADAHSRYSDGIKLIYGAQFDKGDVYETVLAKNREGIKVLYKLISGKDITPEERQNVLIGCCPVCCENRLPKEATQYDYLELLPGEANGDIYRLGKELNLPVVAVEDCCYISPEDRVCMEIIGNKEPMYLQTTEQMLTRFAYLGEDAAYEVVITNPNRIADAIAQVELKGEPVANFSTEEDRETVERLCREKLESLYGKACPQQIKHRLEEEFALVGDHAKLYLLSREATTYLHKKGAPTGSRGTIASSLMAYLLDIVDINPLPAHYRCDECKHTEFVQAACGFDLPGKACPHCGNTMHGDGHNIPYETCMGAQGDIRPDIDINTPIQLTNDTRSHLAQLYGESRVALAGDTTHLMENRAQKKVEAYLQTHPTALSPQNIVKKLRAVKIGDHVREYGLVFLPEGKQWEDYTPVRTLPPEQSAISASTHMCYDDIMDSLPKIDILGYTVLDRLQKLYSVTGVKPEQVQYDDPKVYALFAELDTFGIEEFSSPFCKNILSRLEHICFSKLVSVSAMAHGTHVWLENGDKLLEEGHAFEDLIATRDDIFLKLRQYGFAPKQAFAIMSYTRKGRFSLDSERTFQMAQDMQKAGVPQWYIDSMKKIRYLFPKAHAAHYVKIAVALAWFKCYYPKEFYAVSLQFMGAEKYKHQTDEELRLRLEELNEEDYGKRQERDVVSLLLEARERNIPIEY